MSGVGETLRTEADALAVCESLTERARWVARRLLVREKLRLAPAERMAVKVKMIGAAVGKKTRDGA